MNWFDSEWARMIMIFIEPNLRGNGAKEERTSLHWIANKVCKSKTKENTHRHSCIAYRNLLEPVLIDQKCCVHVFLLSFFWIAANDQNSLISWIFGCLFGGRACTKHFRFQRIHDIDVLIQFYLFYVHWSLALLGYCLCN